MLIENLGKVKSVKITTLLDDYAEYETSFYAQKITDIEKIAAVMSGFHLIEASEERIQKTCRALKQMNIGLVVAGHCTGFMASAKIAQGM